MDDETFDYANAEIELDENFEDEVISTDDSSIDENSEINESEDMLNEEEKGLLTLLKGNKRVKWSAAKMKELNNMFNGEI